MGKLFSRETILPLNIYTVEPIGQSFTLSSIQPILKDLEEKTQNITKIIIGQNTYDEDSLSQFANIIQECQNISIADFSAVLPSVEFPEHLEILNSTLLCLRNIYEVDLSNNHLTEYSIDTLSFLFHSSRLKSIKLNDNLLGVEGAMKLAEAFRNSELELYVFCAERNLLEDQGVLELSQAFSKMKSLRQISLSENRLGKEGIVVLCNSLLQNPEMQVLDLDHSFFNEEASHAALDSLLQNHEFFYRISLNDCFLGNAGAVTVFSALNSSNYHLRELHMAYNEIDDDAVGVCIEEILKSRMSLEVLVN